MTTRIHCDLCAHTEPTDILDQPDGWITVNNRDICPTCIDILDTALQKKATP